MDQTMDKDTMNEERKEIWEVVKPNSISLDNMELPITQLIEFLIEEEQAANDLGYEDVEISIQWEYEGAYLDLYGTRLENDKEYNVRMERARIAAVKKAKSAATRQANKKKKAEMLEEVERAELVRLTNKYKGK